MGPRGARRAAPRAAGCSTELEDVTEVEYRQLRLENVVLVGVHAQGETEDAENSLRELAGTRPRPPAPSCWTACCSGARTPTPATYVGRGKAEELRDIVAAVGADTVIADTELAPSQRRALEDVVKVKVIDRTTRDPRHLQPAREEPRGQGPGRARAARVPAARACAAGVTR